MSTCVVAQPGGCTWGIWVDCSEIVHYDCSTLVSSLVKDCDDFDCDEIEEDLWLCPTYLAAETQPKSNVADGYTPASAGWENIQSIGCVYCLEERSCSAVCDANHKCTQNQMGSWSTVTNSGVYYALSGVVECL